MGTVVSQPHRGIAESDEKGPLLSHDFLSCWYFASNAFIRRTFETVMPPYFGHPMILALVTKLAGP